MRAERVSPGFGTRAIEDAASRRGHRRRSRAPRAPPPQPVVGLLTEADAGLVLIRAHVNHLRNVYADRAVLALNVVPAAAVQRPVERLELVVAHAQRQRLPALAADRYASRAGRHQCAPTPAAGCTI